MKLKRYALVQLQTGFLPSAAGMVLIAMPGIAEGAVHEQGGGGMGSVATLAPTMVAVFVSYVFLVAQRLSLRSTPGRPVKDVACEGTLEPRAGTWGALNLDWTVGLPMTHRALRE